MKNHHRSLKLGLLIIIGLSLGIMGHLTRASADTYVKEASMTPKTYVRASSAGAMYTLKISSSTVSFSKKTHYLKNYPSTTWEATKKLYEKKANGATYLYYYVTNKSGSVSGWIWHKYLKAGATYATLYGYAKDELGKPYSYGGNGPSSFDCSGLTKYVYAKAADKTLPRTAQSQYDTYTHVSSSKLEKGDLAFFGGSTSSITHVGIYIGDGMMLDAQNYGVISEAIHVSWWHVVGYAWPETLVQ
ncbi:C40 family peptidase [Secundilactobacillus paracollinoides]|uniref:C40 family peptidase n=1 Tax=Secundilactobacillus paracollinoides TaxID=240427 RepID=UPI0006CF7855|nr:NlpC/P60 family protein [Secundilactobacillus paracollinoides]KRL77481.1 D-alanyl-D-alanine carboxypeptidase [Secundilactobacillus paracollinoides DSM 15502 = JCM 11969]